MSQFRFLKSRDDYYRHFTALDIGTDLVKALVVRREAPNGIVLGVSREPQHPDAMAGGAIGDVDLVIDGCNRALEAAAKDYVSKDPAWPKRTESCDKSS